MGTFTHTIMLISASGDIRETLEALMDTGAMFTVIPAPMLERLDVGNAAVERSLAII